MSRRSIILARCSQWQEVLGKHGWHVVEIDAAPGIGRLRIIARRPANAPAYRVEATVVEVWNDGPDADGLVPPEHGCHLERSAWHAQFGDRGGGMQALRLEIDRRKPRALRIHVHPYGRANDVREARSHLGTPDQWVIEVEGVLYGLHGD